MIKKQKMLLLLLIFLLLFSSFPIHAEKKDSLSRKETACLIANAANIENTSLLYGYGDADLKENQPVTKIETLCLISRAFGMLPSPLGNNKRQGIFLELPFLPEWSKKEISNLSQAGLLDSSEYSNLWEPMSETEVRTLIQRVWSYLGQEEKDDFYSTVNKTYLDQSVILPGHSKDTSFSQLDQQNKEKLKKILKDCQAKQNFTTLKEQKITAFYETALDTETQTKQGIQPLKKFLTLFENSKTCSDFLNAESYLIQNTGSGILFRFYVSPDEKNSQRNILTFAGPAFRPDKGAFEENNISVLNAYENYITKCFRLAGKSEKEAKQAAKRTMNLNKKLAESSLDLSAYYDVEQTYHPYSKEEFYSLFPNLDFHCFWRECSLDKAETILVADENLAKKCSLLFQEEFLQDWKDFAISSLLLSYAPYLGNEFTQAYEQFAEQAYGMEPQTIEDKAVMVICNYLENYIGQLYIERYFSEEVKIEIEAMAKNFVKIYKQKIKNLDWMSQKTKQQAIKKLNCLNIKVGYPDKWNTWIEDQAKMIPPDQGGTLCQNIMECNRLDWQQQVAQLTENVDPHLWRLSVYTVNAYYSPVANEIVFPAGILQPPFYSVTAKPEENYGSIGVIIAHEISHAFDQSGARFDKNGNAVNWWVPEDAIKFEEKCNKVIQFYDKIEIVPGIKSNGLQTLGENIADLGGVSCALEVVKTLPHPDFSLFFKSYANVMKSTSDRKGIDQEKRTDTHSNGKIRVNRTVVHFQEFYDTFQIKEGDGMYVNPQDRIHIW